MWSLVWLLAVVAAFVGAQPLGHGGNGGDVCMPRVTNTLDSLREQIAALPRESEFRRNTEMMAAWIGSQIELDLLSVAGRHELVCLIDEAESVHDLIHSLNLDQYENEIQEGYGIYMMVYHVVGGKETAVKLLDALQKFLAWMIQTGFPSVPFNGATEEEINIALLEVFQAVHPVLDMFVAGDIDEHNVTVFIQNLAHAFAVSTTVEEFDSQLPRPHQSVRFYIRQKPDFPIILQALEADEVLIEEFDKRGLFDLPAHTEDEHHV